MVLVPFSTDFYADLEKLGYALVSYENLLFIKSRSKKGFKCFFFMFLTLYGDLLFSFKRKAQKFYKAPFQASYAPKCH